MIRKPVGEVALWSEMNRDFDRHATADTGETRVDGKKFTAFMRFFKIPNRRLVPMIADGFRPLSQVLLPAAADLSESSARTADNRGGAARLCSREMCCAVADGGPRRRCRFFYLSKICCRLFWGDPLLCGRETDSTCGDPTVTVRRMPR